VAKLEQTEVASQAHITHHERLFDALRVGIVVHAPDSTILLSNPEASRLLGLTPEQMQGKAAIDPSWQFVGEDGSPMPLEDYPVNRVLSSHEELPEYVVGVDRPASSDRVWVRVHAYPEFGPQQELQDVVVTFVDITARMQLEEALRESEAIFDYFMEYSPVHVFFKDNKLRALRLSKNYETMLGKPRSELMGKSMTELFPSDLADRMMADDMRIMKEGKAITVEEVFDDKTYLTTKFPIWVDGAPRYLAGFTMDISQRKRDEKEKDVLQKELLQAQKMESVGRLAGGVAHDFNNMIMGILGYADLCRDEVPADHPVVGYLNELTSTAKRSADLTRQLLAFARKQDIVPLVLDLNDVISGMLELLRRLIGKNIDLVWEPGADLWTTRVDPTQIDQVLMNLFVNAKDAIEGAGKVVITSANVVVDHADCTQQVNMVPGEYVRIAIRDDGCGIDQAALAQIFEPFYTTKGPGEGTGLGLATVYGVVKQNGGFINVQSDVNRGTTFEICLPRCTDEDARPTVAADAEATEAVPVPQSRGETVLLVDDERALRVTCGRFLTRLGYTTLVAASPAEAQKIATGHQGKIDLLLTDIVMPGMNGIELAKQLTSTLPHLRTLYMSGNVTDSATDPGKEMDARCFLGKPFSRDQLARKLREVMDGVDLTLRANSVIKE
jgi:two-component system cell cycle sensor histidine kinase/response regulator CckA